MPSDETPVYIPVEEVADLLGVSLRQATRYAKKVRTQQDGRRYLYHLGDVERLAQERGAKHDRPLAVHTEVMPPGEMLDIITRLSQDNGRLQEQLKTQQRRLEEVEQERRQLALDTDKTRDEIAKAGARAKAAEAEADRLRLELEHARRSWWRRLFSK